MEAGALGGSGAHSGAVTAGTMSGETRGGYVVGAGCDLGDSARARLVLKLVSLRRLGRGFGFT